MRKKTKKKVLKQKKPNIKKVRKRKVKTKKKLERQKLYGGSQKQEGNIPFRRDNRKARGKWVRLTRLEE